MIKSMSRRTKEGVLLVPRTMTVACFCLTIWTRAFYNPKTWERKKTANVIAAQHSINLCIFFPELMCVCALLLLFHYSIFHVPLKCHLAKESNGIGFIYQSSNHRKRKKNVRVSDFFCRIKLQSISLP